MVAERAKNLGIGYLEQDQTTDAERVFREVVRSAPDEVLGYTNMGATFLRQSKIDSALAWLNEASRRAPDNTHVLHLISEAHVAVGQWSEAVDALDRAVAADSDDAVTRFARLKAVAQVEAPSEVKVAEDIESLLRLLPHNPVVRLRHAGWSAENGDFASARDSYDQMSSLLEDAQVPTRVTDLVTRGLTQQDAGLASRGFSVLENVVRPTERYKQALEVVQPSVPLPITRFSSSFRERLRSEAPEAVPVAWSSSVSIDTGSGVSGSLDFADLNGDGIDDLLVSVNGQTSVWTISGSESERIWEGPGATYSRFVDSDNDGVFDLLVATGNGVRLFKGDTASAFTDVTQAAELEASGSRFAVIDFDNEGDLDLVTGGPDGLHAWQNRGDGRFRNLDERAGLGGLSDVSSLLVLDHDDDDDADLVVIDGSGELRFYDNVRLSRFVPAHPELGDGRYAEVLRADFDNDGEVDLVTRSESGQLSVIKWSAGEYGDSTTLVGDRADAVALADLDNDGWSDVVATDGGSVFWLRNDGLGGWARSEIGELLDNVIALSASDADGDGDLDVFALTSGRVRVFDNEGGNANRWLRVSLVGLQTRGTKNNLHGIGSRIEVKAGAHFQALYADRPVTHFGLAQRDSADLVRVTWSNGVPQNVFHPTTNQTIREKQVLKGSCPYLYVWDGEKYRFVTDLLGGAPLGLQLADGVIAPDNPREIVKVEAEWLKPKDGAFEFQFTEELWETIYLDEVGLWAVDHPNDIEVFTDERFLPPPYRDPEIVASQGRVYPTRATNTHGEDVVDALNSFDYQFPESLRPTIYQGLVEPHSLTMEFGDVSELNNPTLVMRGWIFWTDTSINVNLSQGEAVRTEFPMVDVWRDGEWVTLERPFGLPKGKDKWCVLDLKDRIEPEDARIRIRTNYQIYFDLAFLTDAVSAPIKVTRLKASSADLYYGGFAEMVRPAPDGPHLYDYQKKVALPVWKDMTGQVTRYGDVTELLEKTDDLMAVFTAGDHIRLRFDAGELDEPEAGMTRSYFFLSDGWDKDSDRNTVTGDTVLPLPFHAMSAYPYPETESFPDTEAHRKMIEETLTREIGPDAYRDYLRTRAFSEKTSLPWERTKYIEEGP